MDSFEIYSQQRLIKYYVLLKGFAAATGFVVSQKTIARTAFWQVVKIDAVDAKTLIFSRIYGISREKF
jgi:hypothetical protein